MKSPLVKLTPGASAKFLAPLRATKRRRARRNPVGFVGPYPRIQGGTQSAPVLQFQPRPATRVGPPPKPYPEFLNPGRGGEHPTLPRRILGKA